MKREEIRTRKAPQAIGPYSQAIAVLPGKMVFLSGQIPVDPKTGELVGNDIASQTHQVMKNLGEVLAEAGLHFSNVVRCGIFLVDLSEFAAVNEVYASYFSAPPPARATVEVRALPKAARIEIDAIAVDSGQ